jgi:hypothetical protein
MPHLLNFIRGNGTLFTNDHTVLISHTAGGILSSLTGVYPDRHGQTVSNSYVRTSSTGSFSFPSSFGYWTDVVAAAGTATVPNMVTPDGVNAPAPWVPYTRAGCDVGAVATANIVLENTGTGPNGDITKVFGAGSPQFAEAVASNASPPGAAARAKAQTDFAGLAVHCRQGSPICANGQADLVRDARRQDRRVDDATRRARLRRQGDPRRRTFRGQHFDEVKGARAHRHRSGAAERSECVRDGHRRLRRSGGEHSRRLFRLKQGRAGIGDRSPPAASRHADTWWSPIRVPGALSIPTRDVTETSANLHRSLTMADAVDCYAATGGESWPSP